MEKMTLKRKINRKLLVTATLGLSLCACINFAILGGQGVRNNNFQVNQQEKIDLFFNNFFNILLPLLKDSDPRVQINVAEILFELKPKETTSLIISFLKKSDKSIQANAARILMKNPQNTLPLIVPFIRTDDKLLRTNLIKLLLNSRVKETIPELINLLKDPDENRRNIATALLLQQDPKDLIPRLIISLKDSNKNVRDSTIGILMELKSVEVTSQLTLLLQNKDWDSEVRVSALGILIALEGEKATPLLLDLLKDPDNSIRTIALGSVLDFQDQAIVPVLFDLLKSSNSNVRVDALSILMEFQSKITPSKLVDLLRDPDPRIQALVAEEMVRFNVRSSIPFFLDLLQDSDINIRNIAEDALVKLRAIEIIPELQLMMWPGTDDDLHTRATRILIDLFPLDASSNQYGIFPKEDSDLQSKVVRLEANNYLNSRIRKSNEKGTTHREKVLRHFHTLEDDLIALSKSICSSAENELKRNISLENSNLIDQSGTSFISQNNPSPEKFPDNNGLQKDQSIDSLISSLDDSNDSVLVNSARSLGEIKAIHSIPKLSKLLDDPRTSVRLASIDALAKIYFAHYQGIESDSSLMLMARQKFYQSLISLVFFILSSFILCLLILLTVRQLQGITWSGYLNCYFPEEVVAELTALRAQLTQAQKSTWLIRYILFYEVLTLIWAFYIQINIDNLRLPSRDRRIDD